MKRRDDQRSQSRCIDVAPKLSPRNARTNELVQCRRVERCATYTRAVCVTLPPPSAKDAGPKETNRVDLQKSAKRELGPGGLELLDGEIGSMALGSDPCRMNRADGGATADVERGAFEAASPTQHVENPADNADLVGSSCATSREHGPSDRLGRTRRR